MFKKKIMVPTYYFVGTVEILILICFALLGAGLVIYGAILDNMIVVLSSILPFVVAGIYAWWIDTKRGL